MKLITFSFFNSIITITPNCFIVATKEEGNYLWPEEVTDKHCANFFRDLTCTYPGCPSGQVSSQQECQQRCIEKIGCAGISYSHNNLLSYKMLCFVCKDDELKSPNNKDSKFGFYRRPETTTLSTSIITGSPSATTLTTITDLNITITNPEKKQTTIGNFLSTEVKSNLTISQKFESTKSASKKMTKAATTVDPYIFGNPGTNNFLSINALSVMFVPFILNA